MIENVISVYADIWKKNFNNLKFSDDFSFYYYSLYYEDAPVYKLVINNTERAFDIYKRNDYWFISNGFNKHKILDFSHSKNSLHKLIPPLFGWSDKYFEKYMNKIMGKYHYILSNLTIEFRWIKPNHYKDLDINIKDKILNLVLSIKKYPIIIPNEIIFLILNNLRIINF